MSGSTGTDIGDTQGSEDDLDCWTGDDLRGRLQKALVLALSESPANSRRLASWRFNGAPNIVMCILRMHLMVDSSLLNGPIDFAEHFAGIRQVERAFNVGALPNALSRVSRR